MNIIDQATAELDYLRAELLVTQRLNASLLEALHAVARADDIGSAQEIACSAIAIAIAKGETFSTGRARLGDAP
jgi:hypothetical protein